MTSDTMLLVDAEIACLVVAQIRGEMREIEAEHKIAMPADMPAPATENATANASFADAHSTKAAMSPGNEPFERYMQRMGFDPNEGCVLYLPEALRWHYPNSFPRYVEFVAFTDDLFMKRKTGI